MATVTARKIGNTIYVCIPAVVCRKANVKNGDVFELSRDVLLPDIFTLKRLDVNSI